MHNTFTRPALRARSNFVGQIVEIRIQTEIHSQMVAEILARGERRLSILSSSRV